MGNGHEQAIDRWGDGSSYKVYERHTYSVIREMQIFKNEILFHTYQAGKKLESAGKDMGRFYPHWW